MYFCVKCGKKIEEGVFCSDCSPKKLENESVNLKACDCGRFSYANKWSKHLSPEAFLKKVLKKKYHKVSEPRISEVTNSKIVLEAADQEFDIQRMKCPRCELQHSQYFEGIVQLRFPEALKAEVKQLLKTQKHIWSKKQVYVTKEVTQPDGLDIFVTSSKEIHGFAIMLNKRYGALIKKNANLFSRNKQSSKNIYRISVLVQFPHFVRGDVVVVDNKIAKVLQLRKQIKALNLSTGKTFGFKLNQDIVVLEKKKLAVSRKKPVLTVLDDQTYQEVPLENAELITPGKFVNTVVNDGKYYGLP